MILEYPLFYAAEAATSNGVIIRISDLREVKVYINDWGLVNGETEEVKNIDED